MSPPGDPFVALTAVVRRPGFTLDVSLGLARAEVVAVLGPNGAGKSTLLAVLAGLLRPDTGRVVLDGRLLTRTGGHRDADGRGAGGGGVAGGGREVHVPTHRRGVGLLAQQPLLFPHLSATANVAFGLRCAGVPRAEATGRARGLLDSVGAGELGGRRPGQLSGGQAQRVALARALAVEPTLLLLDEPLAALDVDSAPAMRGLLHRELRRPGRTAVLVTHDVLDALTLADRVVVLTGGTIAEQGPTREVLTRPRSPFAARIAGLNLVAGTAVAGGLRARDGSLVGGRTAGAMPGQDAVAVFSPAAVAVFDDRPGGSPRTAVEVVLAGLEPRGELVRLRAAAPDGGPDWVDGLAADVTPAAVADLAGGTVLEPGARLWFAVKAAEVSVHPSGDPGPDPGPEASRSDPVKQ